MPAPYFQPVIIGNTVYDLTHLDPITFVTASAKLGRAISTRCRFTTHTFTEAAPEGHSGPTLLDEGKRPRLFSQDRYALSKHLPTAVRLFVEPDRYVWEGAHERNWLHRADVALVAGGEEITYQVFFALRRAARGAGVDIDMVVESAYAFDPLRRPKTIGRMKIVGVLTAVVEGRKPHTQRKP